MEREFVLKLRYILSALCCYLNTRSTVGCENFTLPIRSEAVEHHVHAEKEQSSYRCNWGVFTLVVAST